MMDEEHDLLLDGIRSAHARLAELELVAESYPDDQFVMASIVSLRAHAKQLEGQLLKECDDVASS